MEYKEIFLNDLVEIYVDNRGKTCPIVEKEKSFLPLIATNCITDDLHPQLVKERYVDETTYKKWFRSHPKPNDIIFVNKGTPGGTALVPELVNFCIAQDMVALRIKKEFDFSYVFAALRSVLVKNRVESMQVGTMIPHFKKGDFKILTIPVPIELKDQEKIGHIHLNLLKKIESNKQIITNLEQIAQTLFKRWFVDFEFPDENGKPYKSSGGEMVESEIGMIPRGWEVRKFSDVCSVKDGTHDSPKMVDEGYWLVTSKHLMGNRIDFSTAKYISQIDFDKINKRSQVERFDILISMIGTVGRLYLVQNEDINFAIKNVGLFKTSEVKDKYEFLYCLLKSERLTNYISERLAGSTQQYISLTELRKLPALVPNSIILNEFKKLVNPIFNSIYAKTKENEKLASIKVELLPKLLSGEIELPDESEVNEHVSIP